MRAHSTIAIRVTATTCAIGLVIASAGFGAVFAFKTGSEQGAFVACLSVLMALALEGIKPLCISACLNAFRSWAFVRAIGLASLGIVAVAYSLTSELALIAMSRGDLVAERQAQAKSQASLNSHRDRIDHELKAIGLTRTKQEITSQLEAALSTDKRLNNCDGWLANTKLRTICIEVVAPLKAELAKQERREKLEADLQAIQSVRSKATGTSTTEQVADPGTTALVTYLGSLGIVVSVEVLAQWLNLVPVLALELGSALAMVLVQEVNRPSFSTNGSEPPAATKVTVNHARPEAIISKELPSAEPPLPSKPVARTSRSDRTAVRSPIRSTIAEALLDQIKQQGGYLNQTERGLAALLGTSKPTVRRAIQCLSESRSISVLTGKQGTTLRLLPVT